MVREDLNSFIKTIPNNVTVVAATKYVTSQDMLDLFNNGIKDFGENRVDSFLEKYDQLQNIPANWHFIGHLQTNKALKVIDKIDYLHSLDSLKLAKIIDENRSGPLKCFVEISINNEESKNGVKLSEVTNFFSEVLTYKNVQIVGLMMMAVKSSEHDSLVKQFMMLNDLRNLLENRFEIKIPYLSMGMSDDYKEAIECGATHVRLGRILYKQ